MGVLMFGSSNDELLRQIQKLQVQVDAMADTIYGERMNDFGQRKLNGLQESVWKLEDKIPKFEKLASVVAEVVDYVYATDVEREAMQVPKTKPEDGANDE
jgi:signal transduction histidine kinase